MVVFLPGDAMRISAVFVVGRCPSVCLSVRPSVTFEYCVQTAEDIVKLLSRPSISFYFLIQDTVTQFQREPLYKFGESLKALR